MPDNETKMLSSAVANFCKFTAPSECSCFRSMKNCLIVVCISFKTSLSAFCVWSNCFFDLLRSFLCSSIFTISCCARFEHSHLSLERRIGFFCVIINNRVSWMLLRDKSVNKTIRIHWAKSSWFQINDPQTYRIFKKHLGEFLRERCFNELVQILVKSMIRYSSNIPSKWVPFILHFMKDLYVVNCWHHYALMHIHICICIHIYICIYFMLCFYWSVFGCQHKAILAPLATQQSAS